ncbi:hypothetical protein NHF46_19215 [Arthrobacter alpinus]|nr:hypothetical protein [Arthrobacter alpinus]
MIRLNDPSIAFGPDSAADLLRCYGALRRALTELVGATGAQLYISRNWQPVGDAIGEPVAETSTPRYTPFLCGREARRRLPHLSVRLTSVQRCSALTT